MFSVHTYGPFEVKTSSYAFVSDTFWQSIQAPPSDLREMFGVYIFAIKRTDGTLYPVYVGKTIKPFHSRLRSHFKSNTILTRIPPLKNRESMVVFLIAVTTDVRGGAAVVSASRKAWVDFIETALIVACRSINKDLVNDKKTLLNKISVPGFIDDGEAGRDSSAKALAAMLDHIS